MDLENAIYQDGALVPCAIELHESSGPVSPRFQYDLTLSVRTLGARIVVRVTKNDATSERDLPRDRYEALWRELLAEDCLTKSANLVGDKNQRVGVSFNALTVKLGDAAMRLDYLVSQVKDASATAEGRIVAAVKRLGEEMLAAPTEPSSPP